MGNELNRTSYPGLNASSVALWRDWLKWYGNDFASFDYNVRVGQGIVAPGNLTPDEAALWKSLTQKRIDVVANRMGESWIIEIVERPGLASIGQLIGYMHLAAEYLEMQPVVRLALICARLGHDMALIFRRQNVMVFYFPPGAAPHFPPGFLPSGITPAAM